MAKIKPSWTVTESARQAEVSLLSGKAGGGRGSVGTSKSFREQREALFQPREFALLPNCQAICLPYDGTHATSAVRVYLKPYYLPETMPYWRAVEKRERYERGRSGRTRMDYLRPFLPGLESVLEDEDVSEIMINGPGNVWVERLGEIREHPAPGLDGAALERAAIQIARPLGLDPATAPILDARLDDGSRVAICVPPAAPHVAITIRRFGKRSYSPEDLVRFGSLPQEVLDEARAALLGRRNILVSGGTGSGKTTLLNALVELLPADDRIVSIEDTLELRIDRKNCVRFEARGIDGESVTIRDLVKHALRHRPDHIVVGEVRGGEAADLLQALNTGHGGSLTTIHANNAESALSRLATCAMQGETDLPWEVTCRGVVDGISMVIHMTRREGKRYVEEALHVGDYDAAKRRWHYRPVAFADPQLKLAEVR